jgi:hypothetical protein
VKPQRADRCRCAHHQPNPQHRPISPHHCPARQGERQTEFVGRVLADHRGPAVPAGARETVAYRGWARGLLAVDFKITQARSIGWRLGLLVSAGEAPHRRGSSPAEMWSARHPSLRRNSPRRGFRLPCPRKWIIKGSGITRRAVAVCTRSVKRSTAMTEWCRGPTPICWNHWETSTSF